MTDAPEPLAVDGGTPVRTDPWPPAREPAPAEDTNPVEAVERELAAFLGLPPGSAIALGSADEAYRLAFSILVPSEGDEAVVPTLLERRAAEIARDAGWRIVPGDVDADTAALSVRGLARAIGDRTRIAIVGHAFGHPATMNEILRIAREREVAVVEDMTGALGASFRSTLTGRMGDVAVLIGREGDPVSRGSYVVVPDGEVAARIRAQVSTSLREEAALTALAEIRGLDEDLTHRRHLAWELTFRLRGMRGLTAMAHGRWVHHAYARYVVRLRSLVWKRPLESTVTALRAEGIPCDPACDDPLHTDAAVLEALPGDVRVGDDVFPIASRLPGELISIPLHGDLTSRDMDDVADALRKIEARSL